MSIMDHSEPSDRAVRLPLMAAGLVLCALLCWNLGGRELWTDEEFSLGARGPLQQAAFGDASHPPLYPTLLHFWLQSPRTSSPDAAVSDGWLRAFSIPWALLAWWLGWLLAQRLGLKREGLIAAWLMALSPLVMTYFRLGRYYSLAAAVVMLGVYLLVRLWQQPRWWAAVSLGAVVGVAAYTDYIGVLLLVALAGIAALVALARKEFRLFGWHALAGGVAAVFVAPLLWATIARANTVALIPADPLAGSMWGLLVKLALPVFSVATGECIDPWRVWIVAPASLVTVVGIAAGLWVLLRGQSGPSRAGSSPAPEASAPTWLVALAWPLNIALGAVMMSTVAANVPPNRITSFAMFTIPLAYLALARGATGLGRRSASILLAVVLLAYGYGLWNYFHRQQLLNPGYAPPWRQVASIIRQGETPDDLVLAIEDAFVRYYGGRARLGREPQVHQMIAGTLPFDRRVWLITRDRGSQEMLGYGLQLRDKLLAQGATERVWNIMPRSATEQRVLTAILRRPAWDAYIKLYLFTPQGPRKQP